MKHFTCVVVIILFYLNKAKASSIRLVGGYEAPNNFSKFHVSLQNIQGDHVCGGAVVSERHVITAAHCVYGTKPEYITVVVGTTNLDVGGLKYNVSCIKNHRDYSYSDKTHDIAILKVSKSFDMKFVKPLKLSPGYLIEGDPVTLSGFGSTQENDAVNRQMYALDMSVFNQETCKYAMRYFTEVQDNMFCTFTTIGEGTCHGDSGGPVVKNNQLVGVVSWGIPCAAGFPDVHTRISPYVKWIQQRIALSSSILNKLSI